MDKHCLNGILSTSPVFSFKFACELRMRSHQDGRDESHYQML